MLKLVVVAVFLTACGGAHVQPGSPPDLILLQINDVYEANPVGGEGGLARVATLRKKLEGEAPVITVLGGDFVSPSAIGLAKVEGERLAGKQMVAAFNALGLNYATFGNHEFDIEEEQLLARIGESSFGWVSSNVLRGDGTAFPKTVTRVVQSVPTAAGPLRVGFFAVTLNSNPKDWVRYDPDYAGVAQREVTALEAEGAEFIVALTHLDLDDDEALAQNVPRIDVILGGHEHENVRVYRGHDFTPVLKADANARTVYIHRIRRAEGGGFTLDSELLRINDQLADDPATAAEAQKYTDLAFDAFRKDGLAPERVIASSWGDLDGREASVRNRATDLTVLVADAMLAASPGAEAAIYNSGSIRIDDVIVGGAPITEYDVLRILPFGGAVVRVRMTGSLLLRVLEGGDKNRGKGGYLQTAGITGPPGAPQVGGKPIDPSGSYLIAINDFLLSGKEDNLGFLAPPAEGITEQQNGPDLRRAFIDRLGKGPTGP